MADAKKWFGALVRKQCHECRIVISISVHSHEETLKRSVCIIDNMIQNDTI